MSWDLVFGDSEAGEGSWIEVEVVGTHGELP